MGIVRLSITKKIRIDFSFHLCKHYPQLHIFFLLPQHFHNSIIVRWFFLYTRPGQTRARGLHLARCVPFSSLRDANRKQHKSNRHLSSVNFILKFENIFLLFIVSEELYVHIYTTTLHTLIEISSESAVQTIKFREFCSEGR